MGWGSRSPPGRRRSSMPPALRWRRRPREILTGKALGATSVVSLLLSPSLPLFGLCYLFRGASAGQVIEVYLLLVFTIALCAYLGVTAAAMQRAVAAAKWQAYLLT